MRPELATLRQSGVHQSGVRRPRIALLLSVLLLSLTSAALFSHVMLAEMNHNEHMYLTASVLIREHALYQDFAYLQMPYLPLLYSAAYALSGTTHYLLVGRLFTFGFLMLAAALMAGLAFHFTRSLFMTVGVFHLFACNWLVLYPAQEAANYLMPLAFALLGLYLLLRALAAARLNVALIYCAGLALGIAVGARLTYLVLLPPFFVVVFFYPALPTFRARLTRCGLPLAAGMATGLLPVVYTLAQSGPVFLFNNLGYHTANAAWRLAAGSLLPMSLPDKLRAAAWVGLRSGNGFLLLALAIPVLAAIWAARQPGLSPPGMTRNWRRVRQSAARLVTLPGLLLLLLVLCGAVGVLLPTPLLYQYLALPVPFLILLLPCWYGAVPSRRAQGMIKAALPGLVVLLLVGSQFAPFRTLPRLPDTNSWAGIAVHHLAESIRARIAAPAGPVATLSPLLIIEAGLATYPEFATGPFLYRVGDLLTEAERTRYVGTSPATVANLLDSQPPAAILVGFEAGLDEPLIAYAATHGYAAIPGDFGGGTLYVPARSTGSR